MKTYSCIDYSYRPASYWVDADPLTAILRNVKGSNRRKMIRDYWKRGCIAELDPTLLADELTEEARGRLGRIHPSFMGGEYLPGYLAGEVEIARIDLQSITADVISIRARPIDERTIGWRVIDEYPESGQYSCSPGKSAGPLNLRELIELLDSVTHSEVELEGGVVLGFSNMNAEPDDRERLRHFASITSDFYPDLHGHYELVLDDWVAEGQPAEEEEKADE